MIVIFLIFNRETLNTRATLYQRALRKKERSPVGSSPLEDLVQVMQGDLIPMVRNISIQQKKKTQ